MNIDQITDVDYTTVSVGNSVSYRIASITQGSEASRLRDWKPRRKIQAQITQQVEEDEPLPGVCGVENPFAGVFEEEEDSPDREDDGMTFSGGYWTVFQPLSHHHHKAVFGKRYARLQSLEREHSCTISMKELDRVLISGKSKINIVRLLMFISERTKEAKLKFTHFVCLPLNTSAEVAASLESLGSTITDPKLKASLVPAKKLHFTLCMLNLSKQADLDRLKTILNQFGGFFGANRVLVELRGIQTMDADGGSNLRVAYTGGVGGAGPAGWREAIGTLAEKLVNQLGEEGFVDMKKSRGYFNGKGGKLHATVVNSKYARRLAPGGDDSSSESDNDAAVGKGVHQEWKPPSATSPKSKHHIDGAQFIQRFSDLRFGQVQVSQLRLCSLIEDSKKEKDPDGFYQTELVVHL